MFGRFCVCVCEVSEFTLYKLKIIMNIVNFYLSKKRGENSYVLPDEIFFKACIFYECI